MSASPSDDFMQLLSGLRGGLRNGIGGQENQNSSGRDLHIRASTRAAYVRFHPDDNENIYPEAFLTHPDTFQPHKDWLGGTIWWGVQPNYPEDSPYAGYVDYGDMDQMMQRKMAGNMYLPYANGGRDVYGGCPEEQFVNRLVELQIEKLWNMDLGDMQQRDYTLKIRLDQIKDNAGNDRIWRQFRVSGGLSIAALSDKVLTPLMGWTRNYHAHAFTVYQDGAVYADTECKSVDMTHKQSIGYGAVPEKGEDGVWTLAHLLQAEGEEMIWLYDYGDNWTHIITVEEIAPVTESTHKVTILDGAGACPREDGSGNNVWAEDIAALASGPPRKRAEVLAEIRKAMNYKDASIGAAFDPDDFDLAAARARVRTALASPDSVTAGAKSIVHVIDPDARDGARPTDKLKKGQVLERTWDAEEGAETPPRRYMEEVTTTKRDKKTSGCCWNCGSPHNLAGCSRCHKPLYCGKECQREHWTNGHRGQCKASKR